MGMRIAFAGSHSTGKTTLISFFETRVREKNPSLKITKISNIPRQVIARGFPMEKNSTVDAYCNYILDQFREERLAMEQGCDLLMSDRTVLDAVGYALTNRDIPRPFVPQYFIDMLIEVWLREALFYDLYVFLPVEFDMVQDGVRPVDERYRQSVSLQIQRLLTQHLQDRFLIASGSVEQRFKVLSEFCSLE